MNMTNSDGSIPPRLKDLLLSQGLLLLTFNFSQEIYYLQIQTIIRTKSLVGDMVVMKKTSHKTMDVSDPRALNFLATVVLPWDPGTLVLQSFFGLTLNSHWFVRRRSGVKENTQWSKQDFKRLLEKKKSNKGNVMMVRLPHRHPHVLEKHSVAIKKTIRGHTHQKLLVQFGNQWKKSEGDF